MEADGFVNKNLYKILCLFCRGSQDTGGVEFDVLRAFGARKLIRDDAAIRHRFAWRRSEPERCNETEFNEINAALLSNSDQKRLQVDFGPPLF